MDVLPSRKAGGRRERNQLARTRFNLGVVENEGLGLMRREDGTAEPVSRDQTLRRERGQLGKSKVPCLADHEQDYGNHTRLTPNIVFVYYIYIYLILRSIYICML